MSYLMGVLKSRILTERPPMMTVFLSIQRRIKPILGIRFKSGLSHLAVVSPCGEKFKEAEFNIMD